MKLFLFVFGASFLVTVSCRPKEKHSGDIHTLSKQITHTGVFGGTYNFAKKRNTHSSVSDHSKYEVYEPEEYEEGHTYGGGGKGHNGHSKGEQYYGHYGSGAQREYSKEHEEDEHEGKGEYGHGEYGKHNKGTYGHYYGGYGYGGSRYHRQDHDDSEEKYEYHTSKGKQENKGSGYHVTENYNEHEAKREIKRGTRELGDFASVKHEELKLQAKEPSSLKDFSTVESQSHDDRKGDKVEETIEIKGTGEHNDHTLEKQQDHKLHESSIGEYKVHESQENDRKGDKAEETIEIKESGGHNDHKLGKQQDHKLHESSIGEYKVHESQENDRTGDKAEETIEIKESGGHNDHTLEKQQDHKLQESSIGEYKVHESQENDRKAENEDKVSSEKNERGGLGGYATSKFEDVKHGSQSSNGDYGPHRNEDYYDHKEEHGDEGYKKNGGYGGLGDYSSGTYKVKKYKVHYRSDGDQDKEKYIGEIEKWLKNSEG
ncbi:protein starmaker [Halyomorpha halys]|uniref:protein starmaker n=1 Tax=Halyomorpha halys TaxID=286706 RepID=UPI0006D4D348|nr:uncharacterized protein DDB_G0290685-like [Halyomorpha halys]